MMKKKLPTFFLPLRFIALPTTKMNIRKIICCFIWIFVIPICIGVFYMASVFQSFTTTTIEQVGPFECVTVAADDDYFYFRACIEDQRHPFYAFSDWSVVLFGV